MHGPAPLGHEGVDGVEAVFRCGGEAPGDAIVELVERPERAGHDDQPPARPQPRRERAQHPGRREVVGLGDGIDLVGRIAVGVHARRRVGEQDVDLPELGGQRGDRVAVADVQHAALHAGDRSAVADAGGSRTDALRVAAG